jgi:hypothetical protein
MMKTVNSISGGKTSAYIAANYPADYNVFALVRTDDVSCQYPDKKIRQIVSDKLGGVEFIGTLEDDIIIKTMLDLEQFIGSKIDWVTGETFDYVVDNKGGVLPSSYRRFCTTELKLVPIINWWQKEVKEICEMRIGFRFGEEKRAQVMLNKLVDGFESNKMIVGKRGTRNKWEDIVWRKPTFPLIEDRINKIHIENYWNKNPQVKHQPINNCVGCFHQNEILLRKRFDWHPKKLEWFLKQEQKGKGTFKEHTTYAKIKKHKLQIELSFDDFNECDSGYCGL